MKSNRNISYFLNNLRVKHRLSLREQHEDREVWYMHISPLALLASLLALILTLFIIVVTITAFTPILNMVPGHPASSSREELINNIMRIDSLQQRLGEIQTYTENIGLIMGGKVPVARIAPRNRHDSLKNASGADITPSAADSILRSQMEGSGAYALPEPSTAQRSRLAGLQLTAPIRGVVVSSFSPLEGSFGTSVATVAGQEVLAVAEGTVVMAMWSPSDNYIIQIQHADNMISIYKHCGQLLKTTGNRVRAGEVLGYTMENTPDEENGGYFYFELWYNGTPVDPENYIMF